MDKKITISLSVTLGDHASQPEDIAERIRGSVETLVKAGGLDIEAGDELDSWKVSATLGETVAQTLAPLELWEERQRRLAIIEEGITTEQEIEEHVHAAQSDLDYLEGQDNTLERMISAARLETGFTPERLEPDPDGESLEP
jgi:hypothetical protein